MLKEMPALIKSPEGTRDFLPEEALFWNYAVCESQQIFRLYGYAPIYTPIFEQTNLFVRGIGQDTDVVSKEMFTAITGENLQSLLEGESLKESRRFSLRPEGTASVMRAVIQAGLLPDGAPPVKLMYAGPMFRAERPQRGRFRQFMQIGAECIGSEDPAVDAEAIVMLMQFLSAIKIPKPEMSLLINSMGCDNCRPAYREVLTAYLEAHADELCETCRQRIHTNPLRTFDCKNESCQKVMTGAPRISDWLCDACSDHFDEVKSRLVLAGVQFKVDPTIVRGLDYYTRTTFEVQTTHGSAQNAICGGGRYDGLSQDLGGRRAPGFGFAIGYDRCLLTLKEAGFEFEKPALCDVFFACVRGGNDEDRMRDAAFTLAGCLRNAGIAAQMDYQGRSLKSQFKLGDRLGASFVAIIGPDEMDSKTVKVRDMATHAESSVDAHVMQDAANVIRDAFLREKK